MGNSSSGIHEASSFYKPVINIGTRQNGRMRSKNIIDVPHDKNKILDALRKIENTIFRNKLIKNLKNPYSLPNTSSKILKVLKKISLDQKKVAKKNNLLNCEKKILLIGSNGFIGKNLSIYLKKFFSIYKLNRNVLKENRKNISCDISKK